MKAKSAEVTFAIVVIIFVVVTVTVYFIWESLPDSTDSNGNSTITNNAVSSGYIQQSNQNIANSVNNGSSDLSGSYTDLLSTDNGTNSSIAPSLATSSIFNPSTWFSSDGNSVPDASNDNNVLVSQTNDLASIFNY